MPLKVTVTMPDFPDDQEFGINGLGVFENGSAREVTEEQELAYFQEFGAIVKDGTADSSHLKVEGTAQVKASDLPAPSPVEEETAIIPPAPEAGDK